MHKNLSLASTGSASGDSSQGAGGYTRFGGGGGVSGSAPSTPGDGNGPEMLAESDHAFAVKVRPLA